MDADDRAVPAGEDDPKTHPHTCGRFPVLWLLEYAHRRMSGRPLCLGEGDLDEPALRQHLEVERCPECASWFASACKAFVSLTEPPAPPRAPGAD
jgi:hypothetical protein